MSNGYPSPALVETALYFSSSAKLNVTSYTFQTLRVGGRILENNTLDVCLVNIGDEPILISSHGILLNNTLFPDTSIISPLNVSASSGFKYAYIYPFTPAVTVNGQQYVNPNMMFSVAIMVPHTSPGDNFTLQIYGNTWTFKYGTSLTTKSPYNC